VDQPFGRHIGRKVQANPILPELNRDCGEAIQLRRLLWMNGIRELSAARKVGLLGPIRFIRFGSARMCSTLFSAGLWMVAAEVMSWAEMAMFNRLLIENCVLIDRTRSLPLRSRRGALGDPNGELLLSAHRRGILVPKFPQKKFEADH